MSENLPDILLNQQLKMPALYTKAHLILYLMVSYAVEELYHPLVQIKE